MRWSIAVGPHDRPSTQDEVESGLSYTETDLADSSASSSKPGTAWAAARVRALVPPIW